ncbi:DUF5462 family protein [Vibrio crassostreae]|uniref:DUF5462 family protein n=1 Tax=Vibrio crassostreae TaxID=246167 RepID=UPI00104667B6|nr:DUF5462 family protein [Vibrio crassostreae]TCW20774.1 hypothetical protein EDB48_103113 [Vibrio crassostreae]
MKVQVRGRNCCRVTLGLFLILMCAATQSAPVTLNSAPVNLGPVNGAVNGERVEIIRTLGNPIVLTVSQAELDAPLGTLVIEQARVIENTDRGVVLKLYSAADVTTQLTAELWLDERLTSFIAMQVGGNVEVPRAFKHLEVRATEKILISVPKRHRGGGETVVKLTRRSYSC